MPLKLLFIDDDKILKSIIKRFIDRRKDEFICFMTECSSEALQIAKEHKPDIIILDIVMPHENGWEIAEKLKGSPITKDVPIIIASGAGSIFDSNPYQEKNHIASYLRKPFDMNDLFEAIYSIIPKSGNT